MTEFFRIGKFIAVFGIKGELKVFPTTSDIKRFDDLKDFYISGSEDEKKDYFSKAKIFKAVSVKYVKNNPILKILDIDTIEDATRYIGKNIYVKRSDATKLNAHEFFVMDLIGATCKVKNDKFGVVIDIMKTKASDILVITHEDKEVLVPMVTDFIDSIDIKEGIIKLKTYEGLI